MLAAVKTTSLFILASLIVLAAAVPHAYALSDVDVNDEGGDKWDPWGWAKEHILEPIAGAFGWFIDQIKGVIGSVFGGIADSVRSFFAGLGTALWDAIQAPFNALKSAWASVQGFIDWLPPWAKPFAPLAIMGVVAAAGYMIWWLIRAIVPGI